MRIGIFFGGPSREREISYLGGKTAYENIDKHLFTPVLVFIDSLGNFILVNEDKLYHSGIRAFYPAQNTAADGFEIYIESLQNRLSEAELEDLIASIGTKIHPADFKKYFDFAFIIVHGPDCEDGAIQGLLEWYRIPYLGPGLLGSSVSIDKISQNEQIERANGQRKKMAVVRWENWHNKDQKAVFEQLKAQLGLPLVIKAPHQGSSIGVAIVKEDLLDTFVESMSQCFFVKTFDTQEWQASTDDEKRALAQRMANLDEGIGFPMVIQETQQTIYHPTELIEFLNNTPHPSGGAWAGLSTNAEDQVLIEEFIPGQEFSCGVIQDDDGRVVALPPTEIIKLSENQTFDFKTKYKAATTRKQIPVNTTLENNRIIQQNVALVFEKLGMNVVTRIDGFLTADDRVLLHDPNTLPGMSPASLIFKQMAELGFSITQAISYLIRQSLRERIRLGKNTVEWRNLLANLDRRMADRNKADLPTTTITFEATNDGYTQAKKIFGQLSAKGDVRPRMILQVAENKEHELPTHLMFKDNIDDLLAVLHQPRHPLILETIENAKGIVGRIVG